MTTNIQTVHEQVKKNMLYELTEKAPTSERHRRELFEFVQKEPLHIDQDLINRMINIGQTEIGIAKIPTFHFNFHNPRPVWQGLKPNQVKVFVKLWIRFMAIKTFATFLPRVLIPGENLKNLVIVRKDSF